MLVIQGTRWLLSSHPGTDQTCREVLFSWRLQFPSGSLLQHFISFLVVLTQPYLPLQHFHQGPHWCFSGFIILEAHTVLFFHEEGKVQATGLYTVGTTVFLLAQHAFVNVLKGIWAE